MTRHDPLPELEHELSVLFRRARALSGTMAREVHPEVGAAAYGILVHIQQSGGTTVTALAGYLGVGKPTLSRQVRPLEKLGLVERATDADDARSVVLRVTDEGVRRLEQAQEARRTAFRELLHTWPRGDVATLAELLRRFNALGFAAEAAESPERPASAERPARPARAATG